MATHMDFYLATSKKYCINKNYKFLPHFLYLYVFDVANKIYYTIQLFSNKPDFELH